VRIPLLMACCALGGCAMSPETRIEESAFQAVHAVDALQTLDIRDCHHDGQIFRESRNALDSGWAIGAHPSDHAVYEYMGAEAAAHGAVSWALSRYAPPWTTRTWELVTIGIDANTVRGNFAIGMRVRM
jgi:hypothetical protein